MVMAFPSEMLSDAIKSEIAAAQSVSAILGSAKKAWEPEIDSLVALRVLCRIEEEMGIHLPETCVPPGGFDTSAACIATLTAACKVLWDANQKVA